MIEIIPNWHPLFVHFTVALLSVSVGLFMLARLLREHRWRTQWLHAAHWNLRLGAGFSIATVTAGWFAFNSVAHDPPSHAAMTDHRNWAFTTLAVVLLLTLWTLLVINGIMFVVELAAGLIAESTGLLADALAMLADAMV